MLWVWLLRVRDEWRAAVVIVKPETVLAWHRRGSAACTIATTAARHSHTAPSANQCVTQVFGLAVLRAGSSDENLLFPGVRQKIVQRLFSALRCTAFEQTR